MPTDGTDSRKDTLMALSRVLGLVITIPNRYDSGVYVFSKEGRPEINETCYGLLAAEQWLRGYKFCVASNDVLNYEEGPYKWMDNKSTGGSESIIQSQTDPTKS